MPQRPGGVTAIAVLEFIAAGFSALIGCALVVGGSLAGVFLGGANQKIGGGVIAALGIGLSIIFFIFATLYIIVGSGMLKMKNWARIVTLVMAGLSILSGLGIFLGSHGLIFMSLLRVALAGWVIWYLLQPEVKTAFGVAPSGF